MPTARSLLLHRPTESWCDEPELDLSDGAGLDPEVLDASGDGSDGFDGAEGELAGVDGAGLASGLCDGDGVADAAEPGEGFCTVGVLLLPAVVSSPLPQPASVAVSRTAPKVASDSLEWIACFLLVFVLMPTTVATPNLGHRTVDSRPRLIFS